MDCRIVLLFGLIVIPWACFAAPLPPEIADCKVYKIWHFEGSAEGWRPDHNVGPFTIKDGILSFHNTGPDPWIINTDLGGPEASKYGFIGIKMRSSAGGANQIYFATDKSPQTDEKKVTWCSVAGGEDFEFHELDMSRLPTWDGKLTVLRLDPVNGGAEVGAKVEIDWIALYQVPARIAIRRPQVVKSRRVVIPIKNVGGEVSETLIIRAKEKQWNVTAVKPGETRSVSLDLTTVSLRNTPITGELAGRKIFELELSDPTIKLRSPKPELDNEKTAIRFLSNYADLLAKDGAQQRWLGRLYPLATLAYRDADGVMHYREIGRGRPEISGGRAGMWTIVDVPGGKARVSWTFGLPRGASEGWFECKLTTSAPIEVLRFEGPRLLAAGEKTHAIFPGIEYLEANEPSSAEKHIGPRFADRHAPHPYKVAVPLMAVETEHGVVGMSWEPLVEWAPGCRLVSAEFESPNRIQGADDSLMTLFAPSIPDYVDENSEFARRPYSLKPGDAITISGSFFARSGEKITDVIPTHLKERGLPKLPPVSHGVDGTIDVCFRAYTESLYFPDKNAWKNHIGLHQTPSFNAGFAACVLAESLRKGDPGLARKCSIPPDEQITRYVGTTLDWFQEHVRKGVDAVLARQSPDGGFAYEIDEEMRKKVREYAEMAGTDQTTLGDVGSTNSGLICRSLNGVLEYALKTGDPMYVEAALKGLAKLNSFTVPRGAQTWEVHAHTPDIYAAGLAVDANVGGYHLTGDEKYLDSARHWALTGLPFIYTWVPPIEPVPRAVFHYDEKGEGKNAITSDPAQFYEDTHRRINPGATIPVLGTTFFVHGWFGIPVQWCGMAWANSVRRYLRLRPDPVLEWAADAVFASCTQQQFDKGWAVGTYPDSWNLMTNQVNMAFLAPDLILDYAYMLKGEKRPYALDVAGFDSGGRRSCLTTYARIESFNAGEAGIDASLRSYAEQDTWVCLARVTRPTAVTLDGDQLAESADLVKAASGFHYDSSNEALHIKYRPAQRTAKLQVKW